MNGVIAASRQQTPTAMMRRTSPEAFDLPCSTALSVTAARPGVNESPLSDDSGRGVVRWMKWLALCAALLAVAVLVAAGGGSPRMSASLQQRIAVVARRTAHSLDDSSPLTAVRVYGPASYRSVLHASDGTTTTNRRKGRFYVIVLDGRFVCAWCPRPPGAHSPHGSIVTRIWSPTGHGGGFGIRRKVPASLSRLGGPAVVRVR